MLISLHEQATTTPRIRGAIQASTEPARVIAEHYGVSGQTVWKWRKRDIVHDRSHTAHRLQTTLTPAREAVAVALRMTLLPPLDDLLAVVREFVNPIVSRSGLDRCLRRHGVGNLRDLERAAPMKITRVLTNNGKEFTDRLFGLRRCPASGRHEFDLLCADLGIEHRLAPPMRPQTIGMVERFNGRIEDVLQSHRFRSGEDLEQTILRYVRLYNGQLPQSVLNGKTLIEALKAWHRDQPELFKKRPCNHMGCDT